MLQYFGFADLLVGAPYEGSGAVYLFRGSANGLLREYSQRIYADDLASAKPLQTFGYSLSGRIDADLNGYPDVAVGAFSGAKSLILRSRPVIQIDLTLQSTPSIIDGSVASCDKDNQPHACFELRVCIAYKAEPVEKQVYVFDDCD